MVFMCCKNPNFCKIHAYIGERKLNYMCHYGYAMKMNTDSVIHRCCCIKLHYRMVLFFAELNISKSLSCFAFQIFIYLHFNSCFQDWENTLFCQIQSILSASSPRCCNAPGIKWETWHLANGSWYNRGYAFCHCCEKQSKAANYKSPEESKFIRVPYLGSCILQRIHLHRDQGHQMCAVLCYWSHHLKGLCSEETHRRHLAWPLCWPFVCIS